MPGRTGFGFGAKRLLSFAARRSPERLCVCLGSQGFLGMLVMCHGPPSRAMSDRRRLEGTNRGVARVPAISLLGNVMAANLATDYEAKLDDITKRGISALRTTEKKANAAIPSAPDASRDALDSAEQIRDSVSGAILHSIKIRPYTTLAIAGLIGFAYGALRR